MADRGEAHTCWYTTHGGHWCAGILPHFRYVQDGGEVVLVSRCDLPSMAAPQGDVHNAFRGRVCCPATNRKAVLTGGRGAVLARFSAHARFFGGGGEG